DRVAIDQPAVIAAHEAKGQMLRERHAVRESFRWRSGTQSPLVKRPEGFDFGAEIVALGDDLRVVVATHDAMCEFIRRPRHTAQECRGGAGRGSAQGSLKNATFLSLNSGTATTFRF